MPPVRFEHTISAGELPQTYALDRSATGIGYLERFSLLNTDGLVAAAQQFDTSGAVTWSLGSAFVYGVGMCVLGVLIADRKS